MYMTSLANLLLGSPSVTVEVESAGSEMSPGSEKETDSPYINLVDDGDGIDTANQGIVYCIQVDKSNVGRGVGSLYL